jgi:hypothetical protein
MLLGGSGSEKTLLDTCFLHLSSADLRNPQVGLSTVFLSAFFFFLRDDILKIRSTGKFFMPSTEYIAINDFEAFPAFGT